MLGRPAALGLDVSIKSLDDADAVLHELAWIANAKAASAADVKAKVDQLKAAAIAKAVVTIDETETSLDDRAKTLETALAKWVEKHIDKHLSGKSRSINLPHGKLGLRQQPLVALLADDTTEAQVLDTIDEHCGLVTACNAILERITPFGKARGRDLISVEVKPSLKAMKDAVEAKRLPRDTLDTLGITLREAYDEPVLTPTKTIVAMGE